MHVIGSYAFKSVKPTCKLIINTSGRFVITIINDFLSMVELKGKSFSRMKTLFVRSTPIDYFQFPNENIST